MMAALRKNQLNFLVNFRDKVASPRVGGCLSYKNFEKSLCVFDCLDIYNSMPVSILPTNNFEGVSF